MFLNKLIFPITFLSIFIFGFKPSTKSKIIIELANQIIQTNNNNNKEINVLTEKINDYYDDSNSVFIGDEYCYDTENGNCKVYRGNSVELKQNIEWFLMIDYFILENYAIEFDISSSKEDVIYGLKLLSTKKGYIFPNKIEIPNHQHKFVGSYLAYYSDKFNEKGLTLINFNINSDSYVTAIIEKTSLKNIKELALKTGNKIVEYNIENIDKI